MRIAAAADIHASEASADRVERAFADLEGAADVVLLSGGLERVVRALDLARDSMEGVRRTLRIAARANLLVVGLASFGFARPVVSILLTHGTTVAAAMLNARATTGRTL